MEIKFSEEQFNSLPEEVKEVIHNPFSDERMVNVCDHCGCFIAPWPTKSRKELLPDGVLHSVAYGIPVLEREICVICDEKMNKEINLIREKYKEFKRNHKEEK